MIINGDLKSVIYIYPITIQILSPYILPLLAKFEPHLFCADGFDAARRFFGALSPWLSTPDMSGTASDGVWVKTK